MCHVLIIEDEVLLAIDLHDMLSEQGATSFAYAETEGEAIESARARRPDLITSDVKLRTGTGPQAVRAILDEHGPTPVIFITGSPEDCRPCDPPARILCKPIHGPSITRAFHDMVVL